MSFRLFSLTSISGRIALMSLALNAFVLVMVALYLSASYRADVVAGFDRSLDNYGAAILTELAESIGGENDEAIRNPDPRYNTPLSGWYWQLMREDGQLERTSRSLFGTVLDDLPLDVLDRGRQFSHAYLTGAGGEDMRIAARFVTFDGRNETFIFVITGDFSLARAAASRFMANTLSTLLVIGLILSLSTLLLVRFGLRPLKLIGTRLYDIREGRSTRLGTGFADEIAPLAGEVDGLLDYNEKLIERARRHVGNLAHGLKTPLAVLANHANERPDDKVLKAEVGNMQRQIDHHLSRARIAATSEILRPSVEAAPVVARLIRALQKIHPDKTFHLQAEKSLPFRGDVSDLEDMLGNLADNAAKWAKAEVFITARVVQGNQLPRLELKVEDDGPGLTPQEREHVLKRGARLDEMKPGSGLGLSIVNDLADIYDAGFELGESSKGGLKSQLLLPSS